MLDEREIIVVSGLPRSGTSLMMQMLHKGGLDVVTDAVRTADRDNPHGYHEFEPVKKTKEDPSWLPSARGKAVKVISSLLYDLPDTERYLVLFMQRDMDEVIRSQERMLARLGRPAVPSDQIREAFQLHLQKLHGWLAKQTHLRIELVDYNSMMENPLPVLERVSNFLNHAVDPATMAEAIDGSLYRNRV